METTKKDKLFTLLNIPRSMYCILYIQVRDFQSVAVKLPKHHKTIANLQNILIKVKFSTIILM